MMKLGRWMMMSGMAAMLFVGASDTTVSETVTARDGSIGDTADGVADATQTDTASAKAIVDIGDGKVRLETRSFRPPGSFRFRQFDGKGEGQVSLWVDVIPGQVDGYPVTVSGGESSISATRVFDEGVVSANNFPLHLEGNLRPTGGGGGGGGEPPQWHWAAKVESQVKYFVYLTFDDGPLAGTDDCISVLNQQEIVGSFLMVGNAMFSDWRRAQVASANNSGHLVGNHSYSHWHASSNYGSSGKTNQEWFSDFRQCDAEIAGILNHPASTQYVYSRLPGKNAWRLSGISVDDGNSARVADHLSANGSQIFGWDLEWQYSGTPGASDPVQSPQAMANAVIAALQNPGQTRLAHKVILLTHDHQFRNSRNNDVKLDEFIQILKDSDLDIVFRRLDTYLTD